MELKQIKMQFAFRAVVKEKESDELLYVVSWNMVTGEIRKHFNLKEKYGWRTCTKEENSLLSSLYGKMLQDKLNQTIFAERM